MAGTTLSGHRSGPLGRQHPAVARPISARVRNRRRETIEPLGGRDHRPDAAAWTELHAFVNHVSLYRYDPAGL
jgi:hypothetical protein